MPTFPLQITSYATDSFFGRYWALTQTATLEYFTLCQDFTFSLQHTEPKQYRFINRPLVILAHGQQILKNFNIHNIYNDDLPSLKGWINFSGAIRQLLVPTGDSELEYLSRDIHPDSLGGQTELDSFYPFGRDTPNYILASDPPDKNVIEADYSKLIRMLKEGLSEETVAQTDQYPVYLRTPANLKRNLARLMTTFNPNRDVGYGSSQILCDVVYITKGNTTLADLIRFLYTNFGFKYRDIRVSCCRGLPEAPDTPDTRFKFDERAKVLREFHENPQLITNYVLHITNRINLIPHITNTHVLDALKAELVFYMNRYLCMQRYGILSTFAPELTILPMKSIFHLVATQHFNDFNRRISALRRISYPKELDLCLNSYIIAITFLVFYCDGIMTHESLNVMTLEAKQTVHAILEKFDPRTRKYKARPKFDQKLSRLNSLVMLAEKVGYRNTMLFRW